MALKKKILQYTVIFEPAEEGGYIVSAPILPGCVTQGETIEEATAMIKDAIEGYLYCLKKHDEPIPVEERKPLISTVEILFPQNLTRQGLSV